MDDDPYAASVSCRDRAYKLSKAKIRKIAQFILDQLGVSEYDLSINFVNAAEMREMNATYRGRDRSTDVLSFPQEEWPEPLSAITPSPVQKPPSAKKTRRNQELAPPKVLGDLVISLTDAQRNAQNIGHELDQEVAFLMVHGILHLCGHDHHEPEEEKRMLVQQRHLMTLMQNSLVGKPPLWSGSVKPAHEAMDIK